MIPTPEEAKAIKEAKKAKKAKYNNVNVPTVEMRIPWQTAEGREIDLEESPWACYTDSIEYGWRVNNWIREGKWYSGPVTRKIVRT